jgi:hypothetical protein
MAGGHRGTAAGCHLIYRKLKRCFPLLELKFWYDVGGQSSREKGTPMPRRTSPEGKPTDVAGIELKSGQVALDPKTHKQLRVATANNDTSMANYVRTLIEDHLSKKGNK